MGSAGSDIPELYASIKKEAPEIIRRFCTADCRGRSVSVLVLIERLDIPSIVTSATGADGVEDHADVLGLDLTQAITHPQQQAARLAVGPHHGHHAVDARGQGD